MIIAAWVVVVAATLLEVGGDAVTRYGLRSRMCPPRPLGFAALGCHGILLNPVKRGFSRLPAIYVGVFALISVWCGRTVFRGHIPSSTWAGLGIINIVGSPVIPFGKS